MADDAPKFKVGDFVLAPTIRDGSSRCRGQIKDVSKKRGFVYTVEFDDPQQGQTEVSESKLWPAPVSTKVDNRPQAPKTSVPAIPSQPESSSKDTTGSGVGKVAGVPSTASRPVAVSSSAPPAPTPMMTRPLLPVSVVPTTKKSNTSQPPVRSIAPKPAAKSTSSSAAKAPATKKTVHRATVQAKDDDDIDDDAESEDDNDHRNTSSSGSDSGDDNSGSDGTKGVHEGEDDDGEDVDADLTLDADNDADGGAMDDAPDAVAGPAAAAPTAGRGTGRGGRGGRGREGARGAGSGGRTAGRVVARAPAVPPPPLSPWVDKRKTIPQHWTAVPNILANIQPHGVEHSARLKWNSLLGAQFNSATNMQKLDDYFYLMFPMKILSALVTGTNKNILHLKGGSATTQGELLKYIGLRYAMCVAPTRGGLDEQWSTQPAVAGSVMEPPDLGGRFNMTLHRFKTIAKCFSTVDFTEAVRTFTCDKVTQWLTYVL